MERNLGLCRGCGTPKEYLEDERNGDFNNICLNAMVDWLKGKSREWTNDDNVWCRNNLQKVYDVARGLREIGTEDLIMGRTINESRRRVFSITKALEFEKEFHREQLCCCMLYQLLRNLGDDSDIRPEVIDKACDMLEEAFKMRDNDFFFVLEGRIYPGSVKERLEDCINHLLHELDYQGELVFKNNAQWLAVYEVLNEKHIISSDGPLPGIGKREAFLRYVANDVKPEYATERQVIDTNDTSSIRQAARNIVPTPGHLAVKEIFTDLLRDKGFRV